MEHATVAPTEAIFDAADDGYLVRSDAAGSSGGCCPTLGAVPARAIV